MQKIFCSLDGLIVFNTVRELLLYISDFKQNKDFGDDII